ncbi:MAG: hypothetical protein R3B99_20265 [Polyangiales bacterium]
MRSFGNLMLGLLATLGAGACPSGASDEELCAAFGLVPDPARGACRCPEGSTPRPSGDGCDLPDGGFLPFPDGGVVDGSDAGSPDAVVPCMAGATRACDVPGERGACGTGSQSCVDGSWSACTSTTTPSTEVCDGVDNDCDDVVDGPSAAASCSATRVAEAACSAGACVAVSCADSWFDCDDRFDNGCEAQLGNLDHCTECGEACGWVCEASGCNDAVTVGVGDRHACAIREDGTAVCWGLNLYGALGNGTVMNSETPVSVETLRNARVVSGGFEHTCALVGEGTVRCWGGNASQQCDNDRENAVRTPHTVVGISDAISLATGALHTCIARASGVVECWGSNEAGQLGRGTTTIGRNGRQRVVGISTAIDVAAGQLHTCAALGDGTVMCWGSNSYGQLGDGTRMSRSSPTLVPDLVDVVAVTAGDRHSCALRSDGSVWCWGENAVGQLGNGDTGLQPSPVRVRELSDVVAVASGPATARHTCALRRNGELWCWGDNSSGQIGDGTMDLRLVPVRVLSDVASVAVGGSSTCATLTNGSLVCWGRNDQGQLGDGTLTPRAMPTAVSPP